MAASTGRPGDFITTHQRANHENTFSPLAGAHRRMFQRRCRWDSRAGRQFLGNI
jgi:hypothetical protein